MNSSAYLSFLLAFSSILNTGYAVHVARSDSKIAAAWYGGWAAASTPPAPISKLSWSKYTHLTYSFAETTADVKNLSLTSSDLHLLPQFVEEAHKHGVKASVSIGGWTGSRYFSSNVGSAANRTTFVKTVLSFALKYKLDGLDFDWEYPVSQGIGCNVVNRHDTANFLAFLQELRSHSLGAKLILTAATGTKPFLDANNKPSSHMKGFADVLDWIAVMNYDIYGSWSDMVGPNAPVDDSCAKPAYQQGSAASALKAWTAAGVPKAKIVLGMPNYGHSFKVKPSNALKGDSLVAYPPFDKSHIPRGDSWASVAGKDTCGNPTPADDAVNFWGMFALGYLDSKGKPSKGIHYRFDGCSKTAYVYNRTSEIMVSFDDAASSAAKGKFIKSSGIKGFAFWMAGADHHDMLLDSVREAAGY